MHRPSTLLVGESSHMFSTCYVWPRTRADIADIAGAAGGQYESRTVKMSCESGGTTVWTYADRPAAGVRTSGSGTSSPKISLWPTHNVARLRAAREKDAAEAPTFRATWRDVV